MERLLSQTGEQITEIRNEDFLKVSACNATLSLYIIIFKLHSHSLLVNILQLTLNVQQLWRHLCRILWIIGIIMQITLTSVCNIIVYWLVGVVTPTQDLWRLIGGILYFNSFDIDIIITNAPFRSCARDLAGTARLIMHHGSVLEDANKKPISQKQSCDTLSTSLFPGL